MVRRIATAMNGSLDPILNRFTAFTIAPMAIDWTDTTGELPGRTWISRGGKARVKLRRPVLSTCGSHASSNLASPRFLSAYSSSLALFRYSAAMRTFWSITIRGRTLVTEIRSTHASK